MRAFVKRISEYAKGKKSGFLVIPQNGEDIVKSGSDVYTDYLDAVDGIGREDFLYGAAADNTATSASERRYIKSFLDVYHGADKEVLITDYCSSANKVLDSYNTNQEFGFVSFAADQRDLNSIPAYPATNFMENPDDINSLADVRNFLYIINPERYPTKQAMIKAIAATNYDLVILDLFFNEAALTSADLAALKIKKNGAARLAVCYMSIGEAEDYRYYWKNEWKSNPPAWLDRENPDWDGNYKVKYWHPDWQAIVFGNAQSYTARVIAAGFDGVYMDIIDAYEYFES